ncbi:maleylpyruvate isomerase family mycothiol-dependent enzyme [Nocardioides sp.]|uniref:maleylpyruvate isomerase family mycothiol-dependent enzyme n=1 Tax=Nocardioides sp. TaxID=35761 RepID=UPI003565D586
MVTSSPAAASVPELLSLATQRLIRTVDALSDDDWQVPSLLPGWSRAHVAAHLALNAEALAGALEGVREGRDVPMYVSAEARENDIAALGAADPQELRDRLMAGCHRLGESVEHLPESLFGIDIRRTPGAAAFSAGRVGEMRLREVEIHHADLGVDYTWADWPAAFSVLLLDGRSKVYEGEPFTAHAEDLDRSWAFGGGSGVTVHGPSGLLGWWSTGRDPGQGLTCAGELPRMESW